jgi:hypothetical protein
MTEELVQTNGGAWPGGPCPQCGDEMPARVVHCRTCRALLNTELKEDSIEMPVFVPLPEIDVIAAALPKGHYVLCPGCQQELRIHSKYKGMKVQCKHCQQTFTYNTSVVVTAFYTPCPHCSSELRAATKYVGQKVVCKHCNGHIQLMGES